MARAPRTFRARFELPAEEAVLRTDEVRADDIANESDNEPMTEDELASLVDGQINDSKTYESSDLSQLREKALRYFEGEVDIAAAPGRSSVVSRDLADVHGLIMPGLMRVFLATDRIAIYMPRMPADEQFARQATDYVNYVVMNECEGYAQFRSAFHDGLLMGNGILKHWWDDTPEYSTESFSGLSEDAYTKLVVDPDVEEVLEHTEYDDPSWVPPPPPMQPIPGGSLLGNGQPSVPGLPALANMPIPTAPKLHDGKIKRCTSQGRLRLMALPPEDFLMGRGVIALDEERTRFLAHRWKKTRSTLIKEGFDEDIVDGLTAYQEGSSDTPETIARDNRHMFQGDLAPDRSTDLIEGFECYIQCDYNGDGVAEWRKVNVAGISGGRSILSNEEWGDDLPFSDIVPDPVPHRWRGRSLFDSMEDVQRIKTVLMRQTLDNIYQTNVPRQTAVEGSVVNPEALNDWEIGSTVWTRQPDAVKTLEVPFTADKAMGVLEYMDMVVEKRTGISRSSMALDLEALSEQTATAVNANQAAAHTKVEEYARNIAEYGGLKRVFSKILKLICKHQDRARTVRLRDGWIDVDPRAWNSNMDVTINTGLGSGSRERDLTMLAQIAMKQEQLAMQLGPINPVCGIDRLMDTYRLMTEAAGLKPAERFFPEMTPAGMKELGDMMQNAGANDPKAQALQAQMQMDAQKMQMQAQIEQQQMQFKQQMEQTKASFDAQLQHAKAQRDAELQQLQLERQAQIEERQAQADIAVKQADSQAKMELARMQAAFEQQQAQMQFEFDKKLELLKLYTQSRNDAAKRSAEQGASTSEVGQPDFEDMLNQEGADLPEQPAVPTPLEGALKQIADSQAQIAQMMAMCMEQMAHGHSENTKMLAHVVQEATKPKRQKVVRDEKNRVVGVETVQ